MSYNNMAANRPPIESIQTLLNEENRLLAKITDINAEDELSATLEILKSVAEERIKLQGDFISNVAHRITFQTKLDKVLALRANRLAIPHANMFQALTDQENALIQKIADAQEKQELEKVLSEIEDVLQARVQFLGQEHGAYLREISREKITHELREREERLAAIALIKQAEEDAHLAEIETLQEKIFTAMHCGATEEVTQLLIAADVSIEDYFYPHEMENFFIDAIKDGHVNKIKYIIDTHIINFDTFRNNEEFFSSLMHAIEKNHIDVFKLLIKESIQIKYFRLNRYDGNNQNSTPITPQAESLLAQALLYGQHFIALLLINNCHKFSSNHFFDLSPSFPCKAELCELLLAENNQDHLKNALNPSHPLGRLFFSYRLYNEPKPTIETGELNRLFEALDLGAREQAAALIQQVESEARQTKLPFFSQRPKSTPPAGENIAAARASLEKLKTIQEKWDSMRRLG